MRKLKSDNNGISIVIGALLLTLLTVTAATSFALFIDQQQDIIQEQQYQALLKEQENIKILSIVPEDLRATTGEWDKLTITLASLDTQGSNLQGIRINDKYLKAVNITRIDGSLTYYRHTSIIPLQPREQIDLTINLTDNPAESTKHDFFTSGTTGLQLKKTDYIKVEVTTTLCNSFTQLFLPPSAYIKLTIEDISGTQYLGLDGSESTHPRQGYITSWEWTIDDGAGAPETPSGQKTISSNPLTSGTTYTITLTTTDNYGLTGEATINYTH